MNKIRCVHCHATGGEVRLWDQIVRISNGPAVCCWADGIEVR